MSTAATPQEERVLTLGERVLAITDEIRIEATGKSPYTKEPAVSIDDVESALRPLLVKHGVVIGYPRGVVDLLADGKTWKATLDIEIVNAEANSAAWTAQWQDTGGTPAAAYSFARKSYLKALFHLADATEEQSPTAPSLNGAAAAQVQAAAASIPAARKPRVHVEWTPIDRACPECGDGALRVAQMADGRSFIGCSNYPQCRYTEKIERVEAQPDELQVEA